MKCRKCDTEMRSVRCPDNKPGCAVAHFQCPRCSVAPQHKLDGPYIGGKRIRDILKKPQTGEHQ